jgi:hypothetical protein
MSIPLCGDCPEAFQRIAGQVSAIFMILDRAMILDHENDWTGTIDIDNYRMVEEALREIRSIAT